MFKNVAVLISQFCPLSPDTEAERNALKEHVYPKLREFCRENYGIEFQVTGCVPLGLPLIQSTLLRSGIFRIP